MRTARAATAITAALAIAASLTPGPVEAGATARVGRPVMGTILEVTVVADEESTARHLAEECLDIGRHWDDVLTTWREEGELSRLNAAAGTGRVAVSDDLRFALQQMRMAAEKTGGAFEPGVGPLVVRLRQGLAVDDDMRSSLGAGRITAALELDADGAAVAAGAAFDPGGIGKGIALDKMARRLREAGATAAFLDFGGSSQLAVGAPPDDGSAGWKLVVAGAARGVVLGTYVLESGSLSTSRASAETNPAGAIIDPSTGRAVAPPLVVTAHAADATTAEYWSTALVVLGREGLERARAAGVEAVLEDADGVVTTPGFALVRQPGAPTP